MKIKRIKPGDRRIIKRFALFPITVKYETRWLETVYILQIRRSSHLLYCGEFWEPERFTTKAEYLKYKKEVEYER